MKRFVSMLIVLVMLSATALALDYNAPIYVVNCDSWISVRESPNTSSYRICKLTKGTRLVNCIYPYNSEWAYYDMGGSGGYVLLKYLANGESSGASGSVNNDVESLLVAENIKLEEDWMGKNYDLWLDWFYTEKNGADGILSLYKNGELIVEDFFYYDHGGYNTKDYHVCVYETYNSNELELDIDGKFVETLKKYNH